MTRSLRQVGLLVFLVALASRGAQALDATPPTPAADAPPAPTGAPAAGQTASGIDDTVEEIANRERPWFLPGRARGSIGFIYTNQKWNSEFKVINGAEKEVDLSNTLSNRLMTEYFTARYDQFAILAPQLVNGTIAILGGLQQTRSESSSTNVSQNGTLLGYEFALSFLEESSYPSTLYANREQATDTLPYGGTQTTLVENRGLIFRLLDTSFLREREILPYFSASLQAFQEHTVTTTALAGRSVKRDNERDIVRLAADNGTETSDLAFRYLLTRFTDRFFGTSSYLSQNVLLDYSLDFGPTLNRTWFSEVTYSTYRGTDIEANSELNVQQSLSVVHATNLSSYYSYTYNRQDSAFGAIDAQSGTAQLQYSPFLNLSTYLAATGYARDFPDGSFSAYGAQLFANYSRPLPWEGALNAGLGFSYLITDTHTLGGIAPVVGARYVAPPSFGADQQILLRDLFIVASSIRVVAVKKDGARLTAKEGVDYLVVPEGYRTYLQPLPTSLVIQPGDPLQVSYLYDVPPQLKYRTNTRNYTLGGSWPWISLTYNHSESVAVPLVGGDSSQIVSFRSDQLDLGMYFTWRNLQVRADARVNSYESIGLTYRRLNAVAMVSYQPTSDFSVQATASQFETSYNLPSRTSRGQSVQLAFTYGRGFWSANGYALERRTTDTLLPPEKYEEAGLRWQGQWGKLSGGLSLFATRRWYAGSKTDGVGGQINITRDF